MGRAREPMIEVSTVKQLGLMGWCRCGSQSTKPVREITHTLIVAGPNKRRDSRVLAYRVDCGKVGGVSKVKLNYIDLWYYKVYCIASCGILTIQSGVCLIKYDGNAP